MRIALPVTFGVAVVVAAACGGGGQPPQPVRPAVDSAAIRDSIMRAQAAARDQARRDSIARAEAERDRVRRQREADSLSAMRRVTEEVRAMVATRVHFDFDKSDIRPGEDARVLDQKVAVLQANPGLRLQIVGHADERGSDEYNLALGNRRALSARKYLTDRGIAADRLTTSSMGEEQPVDPGHTEAAWAQNRRAEFTITGGGDMLRRPPGM